MHCDEGIQIGVFYLNHRIDAPKARIRPDGDGREWRNDQALFIGSESPTETIFRACHDGKRLYLLTERLDPASTGATEIRLSVEYGRAAHRSDHRSRRFGRQPDSRHSRRQPCGPHPCGRSGTRHGDRSASRRIASPARRHAAVQCDGSQRSGRGRIHRRNGRPRNMDAYRTEIITNPNNP